MAQSVEATVTVLLVIHTVTHVPTVSIRSLDLTIIYSHELLVYLLLK